MLHLFLPLTPLWQIPKCTELSFPSCHGFLSRASIFKTIPRLSHVVFSEDASILQQWYNLANLIDMLWRFHLGYEIHAEVGLLGQHTFGRQCENWLYFPSPNTSCVLSGTRPSGNYISLPREMLISVRCQVHSITWIFKLSYPNFNLCRFLI